MGVISTSEELDMESIPMEKEIQPKLDGSTTPSKTKKSISKERSTIITKTATLLTFTSTSSKPSLTPSPKLLSTMVVTRLLLLLLSAVAFFGILYAILSTLPPITDPSQPLHQRELHIPKTIPEVKQVATILGIYAHAHYYRVLLLFSVTYLFKQTYGIPGSVFLNILAGSLYGIPGFFLVCLLSTAGSCLCYVLFKHLGRAMLESISPNRLSQLRHFVKFNKSDLFFSLLFLRLFPFTPNWFVNMASPLVGVPLHYFIITALIGLAPYNFICVQAGCFLNEIHSVNDFLHVTVLLKLFFVAILTLIPPVVAKRYRRNTIV